MDDAFTGNDVAPFLGAKESSKPFMDQPFTVNQGIDTARNITGLGLKRGRGRPRKRGGDLSSDMARNIVNGVGNNVMNRLKGGDIWSDMGDSINHTFTQTIPSALIHQGIPMAGQYAGSALGSLAGAELGPVGSIAGGYAGSQLGKNAGDQLANYVGKQTGYGIGDFARKIMTHGVVGATAKDHHIKQFIANHLMSGVHPSDIILSGRGIFGRTFDRAVTSAIGKDSKKALYGLAENYGKPVLMKAIDTAAQFAVANGMPPEAAVMGHNIANAYVHNPSHFQNPHN